MTNQDFSKAPSGAKLTTSSSSKLFLPGPGTVLSICIGAMSILKAIEDGLKIGLAPVLSDFLKLYEKAVSFGLFVFDLLIPYVFHWPFGLSWKYIFVPMMLYFASAAWGNLVAHNDRRFALFDLAVGFMLAFYSSLAASAYSLDTARLEPVLIIAGAFICFSLADVLYHRFFFSRPPDSSLDKSNFRLLFLAYPITDTVIAGATMALAYLLSERNGGAIPMLVQVLFMVVAMAVRNIAGGFYLATFNKKANSNWVRGLSDSGTFFHGLRVLSTLVSAMAIIAASRGGWPSWV